MSTHTESIPYFSVVICTYNGAESISETIKSLLKQKINHSKYELIVVNDGSTDETANIVQSFPIKLISHSSNKGISDARNTGLKNASGRIYVCFDDDCVADENWLANLEMTYESRKDIIGVGGYFMSNDAKGYLSKYLQANEYGNADPSINGEYTLINRLLNYLKRMTLGLNTETTIYKVDELASANSSFPVEMLKSIGGWRPRYAALEDTDLCFRLKKEFPTKAFYINKHATLTHTVKYGVKKFLYTQSKKNAVRYKLYKEMGLIAPIFPFPILLTISSIALMFYSFSLTIVTIIFLPFILYFSWTIRAFKDREVIFLTYPYFQLLVESVMLLATIEEIYSS